MAEVSRVHDMIRAARLASLVTLAQGGMMATPLPLMLTEEGPFGTLYGHIARANPQWRGGSATDGMAIFMGAEAYVSPSLYPSKEVTAKVVPTWNYEAVHAYGPVAFFDDRARLHALVRALTDRHEAGRAAPWNVDDAPKPFVDAQLRAIIGVRMPITRLEGKRKMSQNRNATDRAGVAAGLATSDRWEDRTVADIVRSETLR